MENPVSNQGVEVTSFSSASKYVAVSLVAVIVLAVDELNPVKVLCSYTDALVPMRERHLAMFAAFLLCLTMVQQKKHVLYYSCRLFFRCTFNNMFFRSVEIVGAENIPSHGPVIFTGTHNNQFVDAVFLLTTCHREINFMIARKSWDRPVVGHLARAFNAIPVSRPQDMAFSGDGRVLSDGTASLRGEGTRFTAQVEPGAQVSIKGHEDPYRVTAVISDTELQLACAVNASADGGETYKVFPKVDQSEMYDAVHKALREGKCLGIFPEGGSHDRTDLLPLKHGVAIIALDARSKHSVQVPIIPVGLNYFRGHRFGGRAIVEFGAPIHIPERLYAQAEQDKESRRAATEELLRMVSAGMRSTIVPTPDYKFLQQIYMLRRLYMREGVKVSTGRTMDLNRRFALGVTRIAELAEESGRGGETDDAKLTPEEKDVFFKIRDELLRYMSDLKALGLRDHQVRHIGWWSVKDLLSQLVYLLFTVGVGAIPNILFNLPVIAISRRWAVIEQAKSLKASSVKLAARDVVMSYKIIYVLMMIPIMYLFYASLLFFLSPWCTKTIVLHLLSYPWFAVLGTKAAEQGVRTYADIVPICRRLRPSTAEAYERLPAQRAALQKGLFRAIKMLGPRLGDLYHAKEVDWLKEMGQMSQPSLTSPASQSFLVGAPPGVESPAGAKAAGLPWPTALGASGAKED